SANEASCALGRRRLDGFSAVAFRRPIFKGIWNTPKLVQHPRLDPAPQASTFYCMPTGRKRSNSRFARAREDPLSPPETSPMRFGIPPRKRAKLASQSAARFPKHDGPQLANDPTRFPVRVRAAATALRD